MAVFTQITKNRRFTPPDQVGQDQPFSVLLRPTDKTAQLAIETLRSRITKPEILAAEESGEKTGSGDLTREDLREDVLFTWEYIRIFLAGWRNMLEYERNDSGEPVDKDGNELPTDEYGVVPVNDDGFAIKPAYDDKGEELEPVVLGKPVILQVKFEIDPKDGLPTDETITRMSMKHRIQIFKDLMGANEVTRENEKHPVSSDACDGADSKKEVSGGV